MVRKGGSQDVGDFGGSQPGLAKALYLTPKVHEWGQGSGIVDKRTLADVANHIAEIHESVRISIVSSCRSPAKQNNTKNRVHKPHDRDTTRR